ncbi:MAG TPA: alpha/beta hydrolase [Myxococcota bacterium]|nr:alpha/beta hydrolase [Myxococcota bacterium]
MPVFRDRGFDIYYEEHGAGPGEPLLYLTGLGASCQGWAVATVPELSRDRRNVLFDARGVGRSQDPDTPYGTADLAEDAVAVLDRLRIERAHVMGAFLGGMVAQEIALRHPQRVRSLILTGTCARLTPKLRMIVELWKTGFELGIPKDLRIRNFIVWHLGDVSLEQPGLVDEIREFQMHGDIDVDNRTFARQCEACLAHDALARLGRISAPVLAIAGDRDILTPVELQRAFASRIPNARLVCLRGVGHVVAFEVAQRFNRLVRRFMLEVEGVDPAVWDRRSA